ncbi:MAG TPA: PTS sugar transporter subunit IIA [Thermoanaerobaculia bacterium]|nr:PTS sugar transporter subunit IIA [Thermoanaerobaculia bacterium]
MDGSASSLFDARRIYLDLPGESMAGTLSEMARRLEASGDVKDAADLTARLLEREKLGCTGLGNGLAIPHCKLAGLDGVLVAVGVVPEGVDFRALDGRLVRLVLLVLSPADAPAGHLQALARISRLVKTPGVTDAILTAGSPEDVAKALRSAEARIASV